MNLVFAHEVSHFAPAYKTDPTTPGIRGAVDNPINEIRFARGLPLRQEYLARSMNVGSLVSVGFGNPVRDKAAFPVYGSDGIEVNNENRRILLWERNNVKR